MAGTTEKTNTVVVRRDETVYPPQIVATADTEAELLALRDVWYLTRNPAGYGEAVIRPNGERFTMRQSLSCD